MKKLKIMMLSLLVLGAVGGALAFNASKEFSLLCDNEQSCPNLELSFNLTTEVPGQPISGLWCTDGDGSDGCVSVTTDI